MHLLLGRCTCAARSTRTRSRSTTHVLELDPATAPALRRARAGLRPAEAYDLAIRDLEEYLKLTDPVKQRNPRLDAAELLDRYRKTEARLAGAAAGRRHGPRLGRPRGPGGPARRPAGRVRDSRTTRLSWRAASGRPPAGVRRIAVVRRPGSRKPHAPLASLPGSWSSAPRRSRWRSPEAPSRATRARRRLPAARAARRSTASSSRPTRRRSCSGSVPRRSVACPGRSWPRSASTAPRPRCPPPRTATARLALAELAADLGLCAEAREEYEKALALGALDEEEVRRARRRRREARRCSRASSGPRRPRRPATSRARSRPPGS